MFLFNQTIRKDLNKLLKELMGYRGRHTELVTLYVPAGYNINEMKTLVANEIGTAVNIKSKATRKNVLTSLEKAAQRLKNYNVTPKNGLIIFVGNISEVEGRPDIKVWEIEPPEPISMRLYRCDQTFVLDPLLDLVREKEIYGLVTIDTSEASVAFLRGKSIQIVKHLKSLVPGKTAKGGQSSARYARVRAGLLLTFKKEVGELATNTFRNERDLKGILIGGPGLVKEEFSTGPYLSEELKGKIMGIRDLGYAGNDGLKELVDRAEDLLKESDVMREKLIIKSFLEHLKKETGLVTYGVAEVIRAMKAGAVEKIMISDSFNYKYCKISCTKCSFSLEKIIHEDRIPSKCPECEGKLQIDESDVLLYLESAIEKTGTSIVEVSAETPEGVQFAELGGIGAFLRYRFSG
ncbi:MAG: peptide chain release factor aRF-1 [Candidatus Aenigmarchaeota archaeon]|nr:peptide chain release factor aRF-1 [Candidatus Aenigmarchaeota archaeon]